MFGAALQQFEELMDAATSVGYAARPLPLFYAISQAGRAIAAVHADAPWELSGHGLKYELRRPVFESIIKPAPGNSDSFSSVCRALSQDGLGRSVELGALWCSLPDFWGIDLPGERWPRALRVLPPTIDFAANLLSTTSVPAVICGLPNHLFDGLSDENSTNALRNELAHYPGAGDWEPSVTVPHPDEYRRHVNVQWRAESPRMRPHVLEQRAPQYRVRGQHWLRPMLNESHDILSPLMTWWVLLFGLSMLARYHPGPWTHALAIDQSRDAMPLERALDEALEAVPLLVLGALGRETLRSPTA
jgi:hypothetical protein